MAQLSARQQSRRSIYIRARHSSIQSAADDNHFFMTTRMPFGHGIPLFEGGIDSGYNIRFGFYRRRICGQMIVHNNSKICWETTITRKRTSILINERKERRNMTIQATERAKGRVADTDAGQGYCLMLMKREESKKAMHHISISSSSSSFSFIDDSCGSFSCSMFCC